MKYTLKEYSNKILEDKIQMESSLKEYQMLIVRQVSEDNPDYIRNIKDTYGFFIKSMPFREAWKATMKIHGVDKLDSNDNDII